MGEERSQRDEDQGKDQNTDNAPNHAGHQKANNGSRTVSRRHFLKLMGFGAVGAAAGVYGANHILHRRQRARRGYRQLADTPTGRAASDIQFDTTVDAGTHVSPGDNIDSFLSNNIESGTLLEFPPGEYQITEGHNVDGLDGFGMVGTGSSQRDVVFRPPSGEAFDFLRLEDAGKLLLENFAVHENDDTSSQVVIVLGSDGGSVVRNIEYLGKTPNDNVHRGQSIRFNTTTRDGVNLIEGVKVGIDQAAETVSYPDGVQFLRTGGGHKGELVIRNVDIRRRNSSAIRCTHGGIVTVEGGVFINNQNANVRFGAGDHPSKKSSANGTYIRVDDGIPGRDAVEAVRIDDHGDYGFKGTVCENLHIEWTAGHSQGGPIVFNDGHGRGEFYNCYVRNENPNTPTVKDDDPGASGPDDEAIIIEDSHFTGQGGDLDAAGRDNSVIRNSCIDMPNADITGGFQTENIKRSGCKTPKQPENIEYTTGSGARSTSGSGESASGSGNPC